MKRYKIVTLPGDGIGPEVVEETLQVLHAVAEAAGFAIEVDEHLIGGAALDATDDPFPTATKEACLQADAVLMGAVGGPKWDHFTGNKRPESGLLALRKALGTFSNLRPVTVPEALASSSPLRSDRVAGTDLLIVRELTGGIYFGEPRGREETSAGRVAANTMVYDEAEILRIARVAMKWARRRRNKVTLVDKANVLVVSQLWREVVTELHKAEFADVELDMLYVDNAAMQMVLNPKQFDVVVTSNLFGDILSDLAATLPGSLGMLPSASVGGQVGLFEPVHGSAPDIVGQGKANPLATMLSGVMMLEELGESEAAGSIQAGIDAVLNEGHRTQDMLRDGLHLVSTSEMGELVKQKAVHQLAQVPA